MNNSGDHSSAQIWDKEQIDQMLKFRSTSPEQKIDWLVQTFQVLGMFLPSRLQTNALER